MRFSIYGRREIDILREGGQWIPYRQDGGKRQRLNQLVIPAELDEDELAAYLDDIYHEEAGPGDTVVRQA